MRASHLTCPNESDGLRWKVIPTKSALPILSRRLVTRITCCFGGPCLTRSAVDVERLRLLRIGQSWRDTTLSAHRAAPSRRTCQRDQDLPAPGIPFQPDVP